jgi:hypothetical protein
VIPILETNSNSISALPVATSVGQTNAVQRSGGFSATLAAAQRQSLEAETASGEEEEPVGAVGKNAGGAGVLKMRTPAPGNFQLKRLLNSDTAAANAAAGMNVAAQFIPAMASPIPSSVLQTSFSEPSRAAGFFTAMPSSATPSSATTSSTTTSADNTAGSMSDRSESNLTVAGVLIPNGIAGPANWQETLAANSQQLAESAPPALFGADQQPTSGTILANEGTGLSGLGPMLLANANTGAGAAAAEQSAFAANVNIGQENSGNAVVPGVVSQSVPQSVPGSAGQSEVPAQMGPENPLSAIINGRIAPSTILNPAEPAVSTKAAAQFLAPRVTSLVTSSSGRVAGPGTGSGARSSILAAVLPAGSGSDNPSATGTQTPFSVFFSDPGAGTESAAATLPKMILPGNGAAIGATHGSGASGSSAGSQVSGMTNGTSQNGTAQNGTSQNVASQNAASANVKDSVNGSASGSLQTAQAARRDADANATSAQVVAAQTAPGSTSAPPGSPATTLPLTPAVPVTEAPPKPDSPPTVPTPASTMLAAAEALPVGVPGPVQMAQMVSRIGQSEMRIEINTAAFGSVEVRTLVHANDVALVVGSEKGDLRALLANELPALANTLQQQNLRLNSVNFMQGFASSNHGSGGGDSQQRSFAPTHAPSGGGLSEAAVDDSLEISAAAELAGGSLSILA